MTQTPAGWYPDPYATGQPVLRYWDGTTWSASTAPAVMLAPVPATTPDGQVLSGWWWRVLAMFIDQLILDLISLPVVLPLMLSVLKEMLDRLNREAQSGVSVSLFPYTQAEWLRIVEIGIGVLVLTIVYNVVFLRWKGATPGKLAVGLRVRLRDRPGRLPWSAVLRRVLVQFGYGAFVLIPVVGTVFGLWVYLDDLWPLWDSKKQALHDKVASTNVVRHSQWIQGTGVHNSR